MPRISIGSPGKHSFTTFPWSLINERTFPEYWPITKISPTFSVPLWIIVVTAGPLFLSSFASITKPSADLSGFAFNSRRSAWSKIASIKSSIPFLVKADSSTDWISPPISSTIISCWSKEFRVAFGSASGLSILFIATIIGASASFAWLIASMVWGITPSSAATTKTTISVTFAPLALIDVNAAWPGVSIKVIFLSSLTLVW